MSQVRFCMKRKVRWMSIFSRKKKDRFIELLIKQAEFAVEGLQTLLKYVEEPDSALADRVHQLEKEADEVRRILIDELNRTFVTPLDREDIFALSLTVDDILDYANTTVEEMNLLEINPNPFIVRIVSLLTDAAREIHLGVLRLEDHPSVANDHAVRAKALENRVETVYREAIADLFHLPRDVDHIVEMLKLREVYRHLSNAADRGDAAANVIGDIVVKMM
jgi:predicted phosphate transport protein (TIGR00153 family)